MKPGGLETSRYALDTLHKPEAALRPLAELVEQKPAGNPLFINEFLRSQQAEGRIVFDAQELGWRWSLEQILQGASTDNVADLMVQSAKKLPPASQRLLSVAACVGVRFGETLHRQQHRQLEHGSGLCGTRAGWQP